MRGPRNVEDVTYTFAPTQVRGQRLIAASTPPFGLLAFGAFAVVSFSLNRLPTAVFFFVLAVPLAVLTVYTWSNHLRAVRRAARQLSGVSFVMLGVCRWAAGVEPHEGEKIGAGFVRILPGLLEIRTGSNATIVAEYSSGQLERAVTLRVMKGFLDPVARLAFTDGTTYDISVSPAGPRGILPIRQRHVERFVDAVRTALDSATEGGAA